MKIFILYFKMFRRWERENSFNLDNTCAADMKYWLGMAGIHRKKFTFNQRYLLPLKILPNLQLCSFCSIPKDSDRTLTSALLTLAGLFPPNGSEIWNEHIQWQPIPVHTIPMRLDHVLAARKPCDHLNYIMDKHVNSSEYSKIFEENRPLLDALNAYTGKKLETLHQIIFVESVFFAEISKGFKYVLTDLKIHQTEHPITVHQLFLFPNSDCRDGFMKSWAIIVIFIASFSKHSNSIHILMKWKSFFPDFYWKKFWIVFQVNWNLHWIQTDYFGFILLTIFKYNTCWTASESIR